MLSSDAPAEARPAIRVYASGINPDGPEELVACKLEEGYQAFKLKVGFGPEIDLANLQALRRLIGPRGTLMADANQAWDIDGALKIVPRLRDFDLTWLEEPLAADAPAEDWEALAKATPIPLAAGENLRGTEAFETAISAGILSVIQPDVAKWGGISECISVARRILQAGRVYCPHYLGGGIGLAASAHVLAAVGGPGMLEIDSNDNPLVRGLWPAMPQVSGGQISLPDTPGLGVEPDQAVFRMYQVE
jgi:L-alanine-DL-glutamate epimerase-like enolase superfamily enzyme